MRDVTAPRPWRTPILAWAVIGAIFLIAEACVMSRWLLTDAQWFDSGNYGLSQSRKTALTAFQVASVAGVIISVVWPITLSVRRRALTGETMVLIGYVTAFWLMPLVNYHGQVTAYSKYLLGTTDWGGHIPGWHGPDPNTHSVPLFVGWFALAEVMFWALPTIWALRISVRRWPHLSGPRLVLVACVAAMTAELVLEPFMVFTGGYVYTDAVRWMTLFAGHWYQIPVYATIIAAIVYGVIPGLMCHYDRHHAQGAPILRGKQELPDAARPWAATLAFIGLAQVCFLALTVSYAVIPLLGSDPITDLPAHLR
jgi:uncharacterized protein DUF5135